MAEKIPVKIFPQTAPNAPLRHVPEYQPSLPEQKAETLPPRGPAELAHQSRSRFKELRRGLVDSEGAAEDYEIIASDSSVMVAAPDAGGGVQFREIDLRATGAGEEETLQAIRESGSLSYVGTTTFGRKNGDSSFTVLTYCDCPAPQISVLSEVMTPEQFARKAGETGEGFAAGFVEAYEEGGRYSYRKRPVTETATGKQVADFVTGQTPEVIDLAESAGKMDQAVTPLIQKHIGGHPFNTLSYYAAWEKAGRPENLPDFYRELINHRGEFYEANGGNCSLFTLGLAADLVGIGLGADVLLYPSNSRGTDKDGHSALRLHDDKRKYLADPGLTIPWVIPVDPSVPLFPFERVGDKMVLVQVNDTNGDLMPDITMRGPKGLQQFTAQSVISLGEFRERLPDILSRLHENRTEVKIDIHQQAGVKLVNLSLNRDSGALQIGSGSSKITCPVGSFLCDEGGVQSAFLQRCHEAGVNGEAIVAEVGLIRPRN